MKNIIFPLIILMLTACKIETGTDESSRFRVFNYPIEQVNFNLLRDNVLKPQCLQCHTWVNSESEVLKRITPGEPTNSILYQVLQSGQMPQSAPRLSDQSLFLVKQFILKTSAADAPTPTPLAPTYTSLKVNLFEKSCLSCHNPDVQIKHPKRPIFTTKDAIINRYDDILYAMTDAWITNDNEMPPSTSVVPRVKEEVINAFKLWQEAGFPE
jgi:hypothetical protein